MGQSTCAFEILYYYPAIRCTDQKAGHMCGKLVSKDRHREKHASILTTDESIGRIHRRPLKDTNQRESNIHEH